mmetsp:Transcript_34701/g.92454  ORF Transcript_34701/g.92454 Transcript_34701/m.92454 type:complete len:306 (+) Transcript_34701:100-1017(+)
MRELNAANPLLAVGDRSHACTHARAPSPTPPHPGNTPRATPSSARNPTPPLTRLLASEQVGEAAVVRGHALHDHAGRGEHSEAAVGDLLRPHLHRVLEAKRVEAEVAGVAEPALAARRGGNTADHFDDSEEGERGGDVVRVFSPHIPEHIHLRLALALRESRHAAAALHKEHAHRSEHGHPRVLQLRLAHPVEISPDALDLAQAERVEASVARERAVELLRLIEERQGLGLGRERHRRPRRRLHRRGESHRGGEHQRGHESSEARHAAVRLRIGGEGGQVGEVQKERCRLLETRTLATHAVRSRC